MPNFMDNTLAEFTWSIVSLINTIYSKTTYSEAGQKHIVSQQYSICFCNKCSLIHCTVLHLKSEREHYTYKGEREHYTYKGEMEHYTYKGEREHYTYKGEEKLKFRGD